MTPKELVKERYPNALLGPGYVGLYDVITPVSRRPSPGYYAHRVLGDGKTPRLAWADAAKRLRRRRFKYAEPL